MGKLTKAQRVTLERAASNPSGLIEARIGWGGLQRAAWHARMSNIVAMGFLAPYVHGGYEITPAGRAALSSQREGE